MGYSFKPIGHLLLLASALLFAEIADADRPVEPGGGTSCATLFSNLRLELAKPQTLAWVVWTTNFLVPDRKVHFIGDAKIRLAVQGQDIFGAGPRSEQYFDDGIGNSQLNKTSNVSIRLRADDKIVLNEQYGPFEPVCTNGKFALITGAESVEVFSFRTFVSRYQR